MTEAKTEQCSSILTLMLMTMLAHAMTAKVIAIAKATAVLTMTSMQALMKLNLCFEDTSLFILLKTQFQRSSTFFSSRLHSFTQTKKTIKLKSKQCSHLHTIIVTDLFSIRKTFVIKREENPLLCLINYLLFMTLCNNVFAVKSIRNIKNIFKVKIPSHKKCLILKMRDRALNIPVFHELKHTADEYCTSLTKPLCFSTWLCYLR